MGKNRNGEKKKKSGGSGSGRRRRSTKSLGKRATGRRLRKRLEGLERELSGTSEQERVLRQHGHRNAAQRLEQAVRRREALRERDNVNWLEVLEGADGGPEAEALKRAQRGVLKALSGVVD